MRTPLTEKEVHELMVGDLIYLSGIVVTMRDLAHRRLIKLLKEGKKAPVDVKGLAIFHAGPIVVGGKDKWKIISIGPTTSWRMEKYEHEIIRHTGVRMIIGKGMMGEKTTEACKKHGAVFVIYPGGVAALATKCVRRVIGVQWLDLGSCEAMWILEVNRLGPLIVAIDAHGNNLYKEYLKKVKLRLMKVKREISGIVKGLEKNLT